VANRLSPWLADISVQSALANITQAASTSWDHSCFFFLKEKKRKEKKRKEKVNPSRCAA
jgi:hypothetical protein